MEKRARFLCSLSFLAVAGLVACGDGAVGTGGALAIREEFLPTTDEMIGWVAEVVEQGIRRPGYPADEWTEQWTHDKFAAFGLTDVRLDPVDVRRWEPRSCTLTVWTDADPGETLSLPCFPLPYSARTDGLQARLSLLDGTEGLAGKIAVADHSFLDLPQTVAQAFATRVYDPDGEFASLRQRLPFSVLFQNAMRPAIEADASAFVGILTGLPWDTRDYYVPYDAVDRPIPGLWLSESSGTLLKELMAAGPVRGEIVLEASLDDAVSHNVIGTLPGASDEWVVIGSHHDGPWASAVEDGSGIAMVLAQARYWSRVPQRQRPHNLLFLLNAGHMAGGAGAQAFVVRNADWLESVVLEIHLEHAARECRGEDGRLVPTGQPEVRWWFTSRITELEDAVEGAIRSEDLRRSLIMPPQGFPPGSHAPPTDGAFFHPAGVPIVNFLTAPVYLFDSQDTVDKVHTESLVPITRAAIRIINAMHGRSVAELRAAVRVPAS